MTDHKLTAKPRKLFGRKVKSLRRQGFVPGNIFGKKTKSISVQLDTKTLRETVKAAGETSLINLTVEGEDKARPVLIAGYAVDPVSGELLHVDFHQVDLTQKTTASVPVVTLGDAPAVDNGNNLVVLRQEIDVEALPADLPEKIEIDVTGLTEVGDSVLAKDLKLDRAKVTLQIEDEEMVVTIQEPAKVEEPEPKPEGEEAEAPAEGEGDDQASSEDSTETKTTQPAPESPKTE